ncbi:HEAT repeat domain-containing protein [Halomonas sp. E19]|uniref:HEAT repeat domain-containing protein n=1 Tax=Halomonas sp. E19 TaxID=3397247 RepID=UPI004033F168
MAAVQALRRQAGPDEVPFLLERLADASWWVRQAAADALVELPGMADADIEAWLQDVTDRYGQDALRRAIAERRR